MNQNKPIDPTEYPKYVQYIQLKQEATIELFGKRSELLKLKHQGCNLHEVTRQLDENQLMFLQVGIVLDTSYEVPVFYPEDWDSSELWGESDKKTGL